MTSTKQLQNDYINMYSFIRNYIWDLNTVELLAELEALTFTSFPDVTKLKRIFGQMYLNMRDTLSIDDELSDEVNRYKDTLDAMNNEMYMKLNSVKEANV